MRLNRGKKEAGELCSPTKTRATVGNHRLQTLATWDPNREAQRFWAAVCCGRPWRLRLDAQGPKSLHMGNLLGAQESRPCARLTNTNCPTDIHVSGFKGGAFPIWGCHSFVVPFLPLWDIPDFPELSRFFRGFS